MPAPKRRCRLAAHLTSCHHCLPTPRFSVAIRSPATAAFPPVRQGTTYKAAFSCDLVYQTEGMPEQRVQKRLGSLPIMLKSKACYLRNMSRTELIKRKVGGGSRCVRGCGGLLLMGSGSCAFLATCGWLQAAKAWVPVCHP